MRRQHGGLESRAARYRTILTEARPSSWETVPMTTELQMLVLASLLSVVLAFPPLVALVFHRGLAYAAGNRDEDLALPKWGTRAERAQKNFLPTFPRSAPLSSLPQ